MTTVKELFSFIDSLAPFDAQEPWDNSGFLVGDENRVVTKAALALDITPDAVKQAESAGAQLIISHHPVIFHPLRSVYEGSAVHELIKRGISAICAHTCFDSAAGGVNDVLASLIGLKNVRALPLEGTAVPMVRIGELENEFSADEFAALVKAAVGGRPALAAGKDRIRSVAVCGGAGDSLIEEIAGKADAFLTGELKHHNYLFALENGLTAVAAGHFETEYPAVASLAEILKQRFLSVGFLLLEQSSPVTYY